MRPRAIHTLLIANRGEIACRIIRTAHRLGIRTLAVYSEADADALHVEMADQAVCIGPASSSESYLKMETIIQVALENQVDAIHPGYGFLSENADFADLCAQNDLLFIGPSADAIRKMGSKSAAKQLMEKAGVPLVPGYHGDQQDLDTFLRIAEDIGYPVLLKAAAGGGGKGMRVVWQSDHLAQELEAAKREAQASFGDSHMLVEKYLEEPRHIEVQVFADNKGNAIYLGDRDCSIQRRHQKVIEEAPAPGLSDDIRQAMGEAAVQAASAIGYQNAGTIEFLFDKHQNFYFMEMNTRLQVEHPVTEMICGQDLVEWQIRVAEGHSLPLTQAEVSLSGHAIEARICAEDPHNGFLPASGRLSHLRSPALQSHFRIESGVREGDEISSHYDSMIAKLVVWGATREQAIIRMKDLLAHYQIAGIKTNLALVKHILEHPAFEQTHPSTGFLAQHPELIPPLVPEFPALLTSIALLLQQGSEAAILPGLRLNSVTQHRVSLLETATQAIHTQAFSQTGNQIVAYQSPFHKKDVAWELTQVSWTGQRLNFQLQGHHYEVALFQSGSEWFVEWQHQVYQFDTRLPMNTAEGGNQGSFRAPMNAVVVQTPVEAGSQVKKGQVLITLEAMKMEHSIQAPSDGTLEQLHYRAGDSVKDGAELLSFVAEEESP